MGWRLSYPIAGHIYCKMVFKACSIYPTLEFQAVLPPAVGEARPRGVVGHAAVGAAWCLIPPLTCSTSTDGERAERESSLRRCPLASWRKALNFFTVFLLFSGE